jgi:arylsulfatase A-like enzyme
MQPRSFLPAALAAATALLAAACGSGGPKRPPNVVLLVLDTVRADHVSCYGYPLPTTPRIDALAATSDRYAAVSSTAPWTLPSHASIFTGRSSFQHGAEAVRLPDGRILDARALDESNVTLAEALHDAGYQTAGFVANNVYLSVPFGFKQGFEIYAVDRQRAGAMNGKLLAWIDRIDRSQPFFAFVNYMDAHRPYNVEPLPEGARVGLPPPAPERPVDLLDALLDQVMAREQPPDPDLVHKVISQYDQGIAWVDWAVGQVVDSLVARGLWEDTLLIVTSDHGEYFGEHDLAEHSKDVYQEGVSVPLLVKRPGKSEGRVLAERISLAEVPKLVFSELPRELRERYGATFLAGDEHRPVLSEIYYTRSKDLEAPWRARFLRERHALYADRFKFILSSDGANELYDLDSDPREEHNLIAQKAPLAQALETRLRAILSTGPAPNTQTSIPQLSPADLDELRRLGYL